MGMGAKPMSVWWTHEEILIHTGRDSSWTTKKAKVGSIRRIYKRRGSRERALFLAEDVLREHKRGQPGQRQKRTKHDRTRRIPKHLIPAFHDFFADVAMAWARKKVAQRAG